MAQIAWTLSAINDLDSIGEYIGLDSELAAKKFVKEIISKAQIISLNPYRGRPIPEKISGDHRQLLHKNYRSIYCIKKDIIYISSIYHQKRLLFKINN
jgi:plasmid stabilization system protein ParE